MKQKLFIFLIIQLVSTLHFVRILFVFLFEDTTFWGLA